jgi:hypothetical protein
MTIEELIEQSHAQAVTSGWWPEGAWPSVADCVNNFAGEISEAWEEYRAGRMELWWSQTERKIKTTTRNWLPPFSSNPAAMIANGCKPEGFWVEIADLVIRLCDTAGAYGRGFHESCFGLIVEERIPLFIFRLHSVVPTLLSAESCWTTEAFVTMSAIIQSCFTTATVHGVDLWSLIQLKLAYNATREHRHGGKRV